MRALLLALLAVALLAVATVHGAEEMEELNSMILLEEGGQQLLGGEGGEAGGEAGGEGVSKGKAALDEVARRENASLDPRDHKLKLLNKLVQDLKNERAMLRQQVSALMPKPKKRPKKRVERVSDPHLCGHATCGECVQDSSCGWCIVDGICVEGDSLGPFSPKCTIWTFDQCTEHPCTARRDCADCTSQPGCGWCDASSSCVQGKPFGPAFGECASGWFAAGADKACPAIYDAGMLMPAAAATGGDGGDDDEDDGGDGDGGDGDALPVEVQE
eukprot:PLAT13026.1.p1 GENE.PLAT13026.1~~PLAT13026.1.p1  ORF type:complete len:273 (+),score=140.24 PLAT13026.1:93-911(+)